MSVVEFFSQPVWHRLSLTLVHFLWQGLAVAVLACTAVRMLRLSHGGPRYGVYLFAFAVMAASPLLTFTVLGTPATCAPIVPIPTPALESSGPLRHALSVPVSQQPPEDPLPVALSYQVPLRQRLYGMLQASLPWALAGWMVGVLILSVRLLLGIVGIHRWRRDPEPLADDLRARVARLSDRLGLPGFSRVFVSRRALEVVALGYLRPMVLLPATLATQMSPEMLEAIIAHELAHIRRLDLWVNLAQRVVETLLFYHPAVWWLSSRLRSERELCCDELAVQATGERLTYASALETAGRVRLMLRQPLLAVGLGQGQRPTLGRIRHILGLPPAPSDSRYWLAGIIAVALLVILAVPGVSVLTAEATKPLALPVPLAQLPRVLDGWTGQDMSLPEAVQQYLRANSADDFINRRYTNEATQQSADLYVVYCSSRPGAILGHTPQVCFPANGWVPDSTTTSQITSRSGRSIDCLIHRFHRAARPSDAVTVLCFYVADGQVRANEGDFSRHGARGLNLSGNPARYVAQVEVCSTREDPVRSAAAAMADAILAFLTDSGGEVSAPQPREASLGEETDGPEQPINAASADENGLKPPRFAARTFNSALAFEVFAQTTPGFPLGLASDTQATYVGHTPSATPLQIPACWMWAVMPAAAEKDWDLLVADLRRNNVPGLILPSVTDSDLRSVAALTGLRLLVSDSAPVSDTGLAQLAGLTRLRTLGLHDTKITDAGLAQLGSMSGLQELFLTGGPITDAGLAHLKGLTELREVGLPGTQITDQGLVHLQSLPRLQGLDLAGTKISDAGLASLRQMRTLRHLSLSGTRITDAGMAGLQGLAGLQALGLAGTKVTDAGLEYLKGLTELRWLELSAPGITDKGLAGISTLTQLQQLVLSGPKITDAGLAHLAGLNDLRSLHLRYAQVTDAGLDHLKGLTKLRKLEFFQPPITDAGLVHLQGMTDLRELALVGARVTGPGLEHLKGMAQLERLDLQSNPLTDAGLAHLGGLTRLKSLLISYCQVTDAGLNHLKNLTGLEQLSLRDAAVTDAGLEHLKDMMALRWLGLSNNRITGPGLKHLEHMAHLESLFLDGNPISGPGLEHLKSLTALRQLDLRNTGITAAGIAQLEGLTKLRNLSLSLDSSSTTDAQLARLEDLPAARFLDLSNSQITDAGLAHLEGMAGLERLDLRDTPLTDAGLAHLKNLTQLWFLNLEDTQVTNAGLAYLKTLTGLRQLSVRHTQITGAGLEQLKELPSLRCLDLCGTQFTDADVEYVKGMAGLTSLRLYGTQITDAGLEQIKDLTGLEELWLGFTQITDSGLKNLKGLTRLSNLDLRGTQITDAGLEYLTSLERLRTLSLFGTQITDAAKEQLKQSHPGLVIVMRE